MHGSTTLSHQHIEILVPVQTTTITVMDTTLCLIVTGFWLFTVAQKSLYNYFNINGKKVQLTNHWHPVTIINHSHH